jgi:2-dehydropantoate 2-reductase
MNIAIVGGGAMGGLWAASLSRARQDVTIVDVAPTIIDTIGAQGLRVEHAGETTHARPKATSRPTAGGVAEIVFFFVKAQHTASAAELAQPLVAPSTTIVSLQNGWGNADVLARYFEPQQIVVGVTYHSATLIAPGQVAHTGKGPTYLGPYQDHSDLERAHLVGQLLNAAGIETTVTARVKTEIWKKLVLNSATLPIAALTGLRIGELSQPGPLLDLVDAVAAEAVRVAQSLGYQIDLDERLERIHAVLSGGGMGKASMLQDAEARRKTEIEVINGAVVQAAERVGMDVPLNWALLALIGGLERSWKR